MAVENTSIKDAQDRMKKAEQSLEHELGNIRTGRANASLLDRIKVDYYGTPTPVLASKLASALPITVERK